MDNRNDRTGMDPDRTKGSARKVGGDVKEAAGKLLGDEKLKREGQSDQAAGKVQNAWGGAKDAAREALGTKKK